MKKLIGIFTVILVISAIAFAGEAFELVKTDTIEGVIFPKEKTGDAEIYYLFDKSEYWTPTKQDALQTDNLAKAYLQQYKDDNKYFQICIPKILENLNEYKRQYLGIINQDGSKIICINYFFGADSENFPYWKKEVVFVFDGGYNFFNIKVNLTTKECYDLIVNGEA